jgi:hypothetical protein
MNYTSFNITIESQTMLSILKSKKRNLNFVSVEKSKIILEPFDDGYYPEPWTKIDSLFREIFGLYTEGIYEEEHPGDLEFFYECQENLNKIIADTTLLIYEFEDNFYGEQMLNYEDTYKKLYPNEDDYWDYSMGTYFLTLKYDKKNKVNPWSEEESLELDK